MVSSNFEVNETGTAKALDAKDLEIQRLRAIVMRSVEVLKINTPNLAAAIEADLNDAG